MENNLQFIYLKNASFLWKNYKPQKACINCKNTINTKIVMRSTMEFFFLRIIKPLTQIQTSKDSSYAISVVAYIN